MTISQRIFDLMSTQHKTQTALATAIGVRQATVASWKAKNCDPSANLIAPIAAYLGVSCDYLCTGEEYTPAAPITEFERELLRVYGSLDARRKNALLAYAYQLESEGGNV